MTRKEEPAPTHRITCSPDVLAGKPVVEGTRIPVERVLAHLVHNPELNDLIAAYPELTEADVTACLTCAADKASAKQGGHHERELISKRTTDALAVGKKPAPSPKPPTRPAPEVQDLITGWQAQGKGLREIARELNRLNVRTHGGAVVRQQREEPAARRGTRSHTRGKLAVPPPNLALFGFSGSSE